MSITVNGREIGFTAGETVLVAARRAGIEIPHLCALDWAPSPSASCRLCVVEVEGSPRLQTSCTLEACEGMQVRTHTPRVLKARRAIVELLVASHPQECLSCVRGGDCELARLAADVGAREHRFTGVRRDHPLDISSPAVWRDPDKCVLCGRCVTTCAEVQGVGAIDFAGRGYGTQVRPGFHPGLNVSGCVHCGQCVRVCPTGALTECSHLDEVVQALADPDAAVTVQIAPAIPATLAEEIGAPAGALLRRLAAALKRAGVDAVFDTAFAADLTVLEEANELLARVRDGGPLPMYTSCSPAWVHYVETCRPELIPHLSTCKSPQQMAGALIKELYPQVADLDGRRLVNVAVMPCTAKKFEASEHGDVDYVLTTRELRRLLERFGIDLAAYDEEAPLDEPFAEASGAGRLFAASGGVMEAALRTAHMLATGDAPPKVTEARGMDGLKLFSVEVGARRLEVGVVNGLGRVPALLEAFGRDGLELHFVEVMSCPGGCVGGGGQPHAGGLERVRGRLEQVYEADRRAPRLSAHENAALAELYERVLGRPLGEESHRLLHRTYIDRSARAAPAEARVS